MCRKKKSACSTHADDKMTSSEACIAGRSAVTVQAGPSSPVHAGQAQMVADCSLKPVYSRSVYWSLWDLPSTYCGLPLSPEGVHAAHLVKHTWAPTSTSKDSPPRRDRQERPSSQLDDSFILFALILREGMCNCV